MCIRDRIKQYSNSKNIEIILPSTIISKGKCYYPWVYPQVTATGEVLPCCIIPQFGDYDHIIQKYSFGNILNTPFNTIWNGFKAKLFRKKYQQDSFCQHCTKNQGIL
jgi:MoaA/NifB/PqqE/SkfB family radical SAM enzyme